jgi:hypothetical protein
MSGEMLDRMKAEARFIRAFLFFRLANWYGDVPFFETDPTLEATLSMSRTPRAEVIAWVQSELKDVAEILPTKQEYAAKDNGRITKGAAMAFLARTYLYDNDYGNVATICEDIIAQKYGEYSLFESYEGLFLPENEYNSEVILDYAFVPVVRTWGEYFDAIPVSVGGRGNAFCPTQELVDDYLMLNGKDISDASYDPDKPYVGRDPRFALTIVHDGYKWKKPDGSIATINIDPMNDASTLDKYAPGTQQSSETGYYLRKWYDPTATGDQNAGLNLILIRYADVLLMYAEAKNEQGQMSETIWNTTIRAIRERAGFTDAGALNYDASSANMQSVIRRERRCELAIEGQRIHDIRRWKTAETVLNGSLHGARFANGNTDNITLPAQTFNPARDYLWAVPQSEKDKNPNLGQNPNW